MILTMMRWKKIKNRYLTWMCQGPWSYYKADPEAEADYQYSMEAGHLATVPFIAPLGVDETQDAIHTKPCKGRHCQL